MRLAASLKCIIVFIGPFNTNPFGPLKMVASLIAVEKVCRRKPGKGTQSPPQTAVQQVLHMSITSK